VTLNHFSIIILRVQSFLWPDSTNPTFQGVMQEEVIHFNFKVKVNKLFTLTQSEYLMNNSQYDVNSDVL
jgi:hypothetical protein